LGGYLQTKTGRTLAFSIMVNGTLVPESAVREFIDRLCALFLDQ
jgi:D-alanyl-D-alanine carboxypeptidase